MWSAIGIRSLAEGKIETMTKTIPKALLCIEAATSALSVALFIEGRHVGSKSNQETRRSHAEILIPTIDDCLAEASVTMSDIDAIAVTRGPGAFTSIRIGLATAIGLAYEKRLPIYPANTLEVLAATLRGQAQADAYLMPMLDARKDDVYAALYRADDSLLSPVLPPAVLPAEHFAKKACNSVENKDAVILAFGEGFQAYREKLIAFAEISPPEAGETPRPNAQALGRLTLRRIEAGFTFSAAHPMYLRKPEAVVNLKR